MTKERRFSKDTRSRWMAPAAVAVAMLLTFGGVTLLLLPADGPEPWIQEVSTEQFASLLEGPTSLTEADYARWLPVLDPSAGLADILTIEGDGVRIAGDRGAPSSWRAWALSQSRSTVAPSNPGAHGQKARARPRGKALKGVRVLLDPGHRGGAWSSIEKRHFEFAVGPPVREGDLNWAVAVLLKDRLEALGAEVRLTRAAPPGKPPFGEIHLDYDAGDEVRLWLGRSLDEAPVKRWLTFYPSRVGRLGLQRAMRQQQRDQPFELYNTWDLRRRALQAESWGADVTISIHHNIANNPELNKLIFFVPGGVLANELSTVAERYYAIRRLLQNDFADALAFAQSVSKHMHGELDMVPLTEEERGDRVLPNRVALDEKAGIYARNLAMLKRSSGLAILTEGPCMNNVDEVVRLMDRSVQIQGARYPKRTEQYAEGLLKALSEQAPLLRRRARMRRP